MAGAGKPPLGEPLETGAFTHVFAAVLEVVPAAGLRPTALIVRQRRALRGDAELARREPVLE